LPLRIVLYADGGALWKQPDAAGGILGTHFEGTWEGEYDQPGEPLTLRKKVTGDAMNWVCEKPGLYADERKVNGGRRIIYWERVR